MDMKKIIRTDGLRLFLVLSSMLIFSFNNVPFSQDKSPYIRIGKIEIHANQMEGYKAALKEHAQAAVNNEAGVLTLYSVYDKDKPTRVTVFEIYASEEAYKSHIQTPHFLKYKSTVKNMVKSLVLTDVIAISLQTKTSNF